MNPDRPSVYEILAARDGAPTDPLAAPTTSSLGEEDNRPHSARPGAGPPAERPEPPQPEESRWTYPTPALQHQRFNTP